MSADEWSSLFWSFIAFKGAGKLTIKTFISDQTFFVVERGDILAVYLSNDSRLANLASLLNCAFAFF